MRSASPGHSESDLLEALRRIVHAVDVGSHRLMAEVGITGTQLNCLAAVASREGTTAQEVAGEIHVGASTLVGVIDRLEEKGLMVRVRDSADRRRLLLRATPAGKRLLRRAPSPLGRLLHDRFVALPAAEQRDLAEAARRIADLIELA